MRNIVSADLDARLAELESRLAFQEHTLAELGDALADARMETARKDLQAQIYGNTVG